MLAWQNLGFTQPHRLVPLAVAAEAAGMCGVCLPEHLVTPTEIATPNPYVPTGGAGYEPDTPFIDPFVAFGAIASRTTTLQMMANVYVMALRNLFVAAKSISSTAVISDNRLVLGVGIGWLREEFDAVGADFTRRGARTDEMLALLSRLLAGELVSADSPHHQFAEVRVRPVPSEPVPVLIGGASDAALARAARAHGWIGVNYDEPTLLPILDRLAAARDRHGTPSDHRAVVVSRPPDFDAAMALRYRDAGVTAMVNRPTAFAVGPDSPIADHQASMEEFVALLAD